LVDVLQMTIPPCLGVKTSSFSILESQSSVHLCPATTDAQSSDVVEDVPTNGPVEGGTRSKFAVSNRSSSMTFSIDNSSKLKFRSIILTENSRLRSPANRRLDQCSLEPPGTTSGTIPSKAAAINNSMSTSVHTIVDINSSSPSSLEGRNSDGLSQHSSPELLPQAKSYVRHARTPPELLHDMQEWLDKRDADLS
jgi:hypothetical protein